MPNTLQSRIKQLETGYDTLRTTTNRLMSENATLRHDAKLCADIVAVLQTVVGDSGVSEGAVEVAERLIRERPELLRERAELMRRVVELEADRERLEFYLDSDRWTIWSDKGVWYVKDENDDDYPVHNYTTKREAIDAARTRETT